MSSISPLNIQVRDVANADISTRITDQIRRNLDVLNAILKEMPIIMQVRISELKTLIRNRKRFEKAKKRSPSERKQVEGSHNFRATRRPKIEKVYISF